MRRRRGYRLLGRGFAVGRTSCRDVKHLVLVIDIEMEFAQLVEADDEGDGVHHRAGGAAFGEFELVMGDRRAGHLVGQDADGEAVDLHAVEFERLERMLISHQ